MPEVVRQDLLGVTAIFASKAMRDLYEMVARVASTSASVLITGESGSGKELVARAVHQFSPRSSKPWVDISCASLPEHLVESELFGYEKGAFSGAMTSKPGLFELAHQGTIFLDEVGELEVRMQVKLLRVLDGTAFFRLGGTRKISTDVRVVAATNRNLQAEVMTGRFREDVFHRLSQLEIRVPPLRARADDIPALAEHFLAQQDRDVRVSAAAVRRLQEYHWPGNVRELRNVITRAAVLCLGDEIQPADLQLTREAPVAVAVGNGRGGSATLCLDELEKGTILEALDRTNGHQGRAAHLLGISVRTLSRKLKAYDLEKTEFAQPV